MYSLVYTNLCKQEISLVKGYKDEKLNKNQKIALYIMVGLLTLALAYTLVKKAEFDYHVKEAFVLWALQNFIQVVLWTITFLSGDASISMAITYLFYLLNSGTGFFNNKWFGNNNKIN